MKVISLYTIVGLAVIVAQTTILALPLLQGIFYDLLIPMVVFFRIGLRRREGVAVVLIIGLVMDIFSVGRFGLYLTIYLWTFIVVKGVSDYFDVHGNLFRSVLIALCVLAEDLTLFVFSVIPAEGPLLLTCPIGLVAWQALFAAITGPAIVASLEKIHARVQAGEAHDNRHRQNLATQ